MNEGFMKLAKEHNIKAIDASPWNIEMGYVGVHFSIQKGASLQRLLITHF